MGFGTKRLRTGVLTEDCLKWLGACVASIAERFGRRLQKVREKAGDSRQQLADIVGVDQANVWKWEMGKGSPRAAQLLRVLQHYAEHRDYLIDGEPGEERQPAAHKKVFDAFCKTKTGRRALDEKLIPILSSIHFPNTPTVALYRAIAMELMASSEDAD